MKNIFFLIIWLAFLCPTPVTADIVALPHAENEYPELNGTFWEILKTQSPKGSLLLYTSGFVRGYDYALNLLQDLIETKPYEKQSLIEFIAMLKYPPAYTNSQIKNLIDQFYADQKNRNLPLHVAFTYARQVLTGYPKEYSLFYIEDMRKIYSEKQVFPNYE
jgi:hypothetical protein